MPIGLLVLALAAAAHKAPAKPAKPTLPTAAMQQLVPSCDAHKFETTITVDAGGGKTRSSKVKLCGAEGQSDEAWLRTLKDAVAKTASNEQMPANVRQQIVSALSNEIVRLTAAPGAAPAAAGPPPGAPRSTFSLAKSQPELPGLAPRSTQPSLSHDYATYAPLPVKPEADVSAHAPVRTFAKIPLLTLRCAAVGDEERSARCDTIDRDTAILVRADEAFPRGAEIHFVRSGKSRAEVKLPPLRAGQNSRLRLPPGVCAGVVRSRVDIQAVSGDEPEGTPAGSLGLFDLRC